MSDNVNKPAHYTQGGIETIDSIRASTGDGFIWYCVGNADKYIGRCRYKGKLLEDLRKCRDYVDWAIEEAEKLEAAVESGNCPAIPDSSDRKPLAIPSGWRELEPDEVPKANDMSEYMGGWFFRNDDATHEYKWHSSRHIRKIETSNPSETPNSSTATEWIPNVGDKVSIAMQMAAERFGGCDGVFNGACFSNAMRQIAGVKCNLDGNVVATILEGRIDVKQLKGGSHYKYLSFEAKPANTSEIPNSSTPNPGEGYRLLSKEPSEPLREGDEFWQDFDGEWVESNHWIEPVQPQAERLYYRRKIEPTQWVPKFGDKVRVVKLDRLATGEVGFIVKETCGEYAVRIPYKNLTSHSLQAKDLELIEAAS